MKRQDCEQLTLFPAGSPASRSALPGSEGARRMTVTSGLKCLGLYQNSGPLGSLVRTLLGSSNMALDQVLSDLENEGYAVQAFIIPACAVDAPHRRDRVCIVGWKRSAGKSEKGKQEQPRVGGLYTDVSDSESIRLQREWSGGDQIDGARPEKAQPERRCDVLSDTDNGCRTLRRDGKLPAVEEAGGSRANHGGRTAEYVSGEWWPAEPGLGGMVDGVPSWLDSSMSVPGHWMPEPDIPRITSKKEHRKDRLQCLGNAVVPQQFYPIFQAIADIERGIVHG